MARSLAAALGLALALGSCLQNESTGPPHPGEALLVRADLSGTTVSLVVVQVTGPGVTTPLAFNIPVVDRTAAGTITVPAGSGTVITMLAYDAGGVETHTGSVTLDIRPGANATVTLVLMPLTGDLPITATLGSFSVSVTPALDTVSVGDTVTLAATLLDGSGHPVTGQVVWATLAPGVVAVVSTGAATARVTAIRPGRATVVASYAGTAGPATVAVAGWFAAPGGSPSGDGSRAPWDLATALAGATGKVQPGDTIWLRAGTYVGSFRSALAGTAAAPIVVRQYPGERAILDGASSANETLIVDGAWTTFWGFEITNSGTGRFCSSCLGLRPTGVYVRSTANVKFVNLIIHDTGHGFFTENTAHNVEIYGAIIYDGGSTNSTRSDGHGVYVENDGIGTKRVRDNVIFNMFGFGLHAYTGSSNNALKNLTLEGNVVFDNGTVSGFTSEANLLLGSEVAAADQDTVRDNLAYYAPSLSGYFSVRIGSGLQQNGALVLRDNYIAAGGNEALTMGYWQSVAEANCTLIGTYAMVNLRDTTTVGWTWGGNRYWRDPLALAWAFNDTTYTLAAWKTKTGFAAGDAATLGQPSQPQVFVRPNQYEPGRVTVVVYNWTHAGSVPVNLSGLLKVGAPFTVHNVQDLWGSPVVAGTYGGGSVSVPMSGVAPPVPIGGSPIAPLHTGPDFDVFLVTGTSP